MHLGGPKFEDGHHLTNFVYVRKYIDNKCAWLLISWSNSTIVYILYNFDSYNITSFKISFGTNFGNKIWVHIWIIHEILYEINTHIEYLKLEF